MSAPVVVCHVLETANAGVRRHVVDLLEGMRDDARIRSVLIFSPVRMDAAFIEVLPELEKRMECVSIRMSPHMRPHEDLVSIARLASAYRRIRPDVLHVHSGKGGLLGRIAHDVSGVKAAVVYTPNASPFRRSRIHEVVERWLCHRTDAVIAVTESEAQELIGAGIVPPARVHVIDSGIDVWRYEEREPLRAEGRALLADPHPLLVGSVGRLAPQKAPLDFVRMAERIAAERRDTGFVWVGDGELRPQVERAVAEAGLVDRFRITGLVGDPRPYVAALDVFCLLSRYESFGYATAEAMALGVAAVGTNVPGTVDVLDHGRAGALVEPGDAEAAARAVLRLLAEPAERERSGSIGRARAFERYDARRMSSQDLALYHDLLAARDHAN